MTQVTKEVFFENLRTKTADEIRSLLRSKPKGHGTKAELTELAYQEYTGTEPAAELLEQPDATKKWQARIISPDGRTAFRRSGYAFSRAWTTLEPQPTPDQLSRLKAEKVIQLREV